MQVNNSLVVSKFNTDFAKEAAMIDMESVNNSTRRMLKSISDIGTDALNDEAKIQRVSRNT